MNKMGQAYNEVKMYAGGGWNEAAYFCIRQFICDIHYLYDLKIGTIPSQDLPAYALAAQPARQESSYRTVTVKKAIR